jgi:hypothetical protein
VGRLRTRPWLQRFSPLGNGNETRQDHEGPVWLRLVRPRGLEPLTFAAAVRRSVPLSYGRMRVSAKRVMSCLGSTSLANSACLSTQATLTGCLRVCSANSCSDSGLLGSFVRTPRNSLRLYIARSELSPPANLVNWACLSPRAEGRGFEPRSPFGRTGFRDRLLAVRSSLRSNGRATVSLLQDGQGSCSSIRSQLRGCSGLSATILLRSTSETRGNRY